jgi:outer membrane protein TolC
MITDTISSKSITIAAHHVAAALSGILLCAGCMSSGQGGSSGLPPDILGGLRRVEARRFKGDLDADTAVALALQNAPNLALLKEQVNVAAAQRRAAVQIADPEIRVSYDRSESGTSDYSSGAASNAPWVTDGLLGNLVQDAPTSTEQITGIQRTSDNQETFSVSVRFSPPNPFVMAHDRSAADARVYFAKAQLRSAEWQLSTNVRMTWEEIRYIQDDLALLDQLAEVHRNYEMVLEERAKQGGATLLDLAGASRRYLRTTVERDRVGRERSSALRVLAGLVGIPANSLSIPSAPPPLPQIDHSLLDAAGLEGVALQYRADLMALLWQCIAAHKDVRSCKASRLPWFTFIQGSYVNSMSRSARNPYTQWTGTDGTSLLYPDPFTSRDETDGTEWSITAGFEIPFFSMLTAQDAPVIAEYRRSRTELFVMWKTALAQIYEASENVTLTWKQMQQYEVDAGPHMARMQRLLKELETNENVSPDDAATTKEALVNTERTRRDLEHDYRLSLITLSAAIGRDLAELSRQQPVDVPKLEKTPNDDILEHLKKSGF